MSVEGKFPLRWYHFLLFAVEAPCLALIRQRIVGMGAESSNLTRPSMSLGVSHLDLTCITHAAFTASKKIGKERDTSMASLLQSLGHHMFIE
jgi:hypothetical protein